MWGEGRGGFRGQARGWLRWFAHSFGDVVCGGMPGTLLLFLDLQWQVGFSVFLYLVRNSPQLHEHTVSFSHL